MYLENNICFTVNLEKKKDIWKMEKALTFPQTLSMVER